MGVPINNNRKQMECTMSYYSDCTSKHDNETEAGLKRCLEDCRPACDYWNYDLQAVETPTGKTGTSLVVPTSDYIEFTQRRAYTWFGVIADIGGLLYVFGKFEN